MPRFLVEVPHENKKEACNRAIRIFLETGSHFMTNADWGCSDDVHKAWFVIEVDSKDQAFSILPPLLRKDARVIALEQFTIQDLEAIRDQHAD